MTFDVNAPCRQCVLICRENEWKRVFLPSPWSSFLDTSLNAEYDRDYLERGKCLILSTRQLPSRRPRRVEQNIVKRFRPRKACPFKTLVATLTCFVRNFFSPPTLYGSNSSLERQACQAFLRLFFRRAENVFIKTHNSLRSRKGFANQKLCRDLYIFVRFENAVTFNALIHF